jgi:hypothetical protein
VEYWSTGILSPEAHIRIAQRKQPDCTLQLLLTRKTPAFATRAPPEASPREEATARQAKGRKHEKHFRQDVQDGMQGSLGVIWRTVKQKISWLIFCFTVLHISQRRSIGNPALRGLKRSLLLICANLRNLRMGICVQKFSPLLGF